MIDLIGRLLEFDYSHLGVPVGFDLFSKIFWFYLITPKFNCYPKSYFEILYDFSIC